MVDVDSRLGGVRPPGFGDAIGETPGRVVGYMREALLDEQVGGAADTAIGGVGQDPKRVILRVELTGREAGMKKALVAMSCCLACCSA